MNEWPLTVEFFYNILLKKPPTFVKIETDGHIILEKKHEVTSNIQNNGLSKQHPTFVVPLLKCLLVSILTYLLFRLT